MQATRREELTKDEIVELGKQAATIAHKIEEAERERKEADKEAKKEIGDLQVQRSDLLLHIRRGYRIVSAQGSLPGTADQRLEECRRVHMKQTPLLM